jgi:hypothetical protein
VYYIAAQYLFQFFVVCVLFTGALMETTGGLIYAYYTKLYTYMFCSLATISSLSNKPAVKPLPNFVDITSRVSVDATVISTSGFGKNDNFGHFSCTSSSGQYMFLLCKTTTVINVYVSSDYGASFTLINTGIPIAGDMIGICCSSDGMYVAIATNYRSLWLASDYGITWSNVGASIGDKGWTDITMSSTGQYICASVNGGAVYLTSNYGVSWTNVGSSFTSKAWSTITMSSTGQYICVAAWNNPIYLSSNYGSTWTNIGSVVGAKNWGSVSISSTGQYIIASTVIDTVNHIYVNNNYGDINSWVSKLSSQTPTDFRFSSISTDGSTMVSCSVTNGFLYYSNNYGNTWSKLTSLGSHYFGGLAISGNKTYILTCTNSEPSGNKVFLLT